MVKTVMLVVITAVDGAPLSETRTSAFCTAIAETPSIPAKIMLAVFRSLPGPATTPTARKAESRRNCSNSRGISEPIRIRSRPATSSLVNASTTMNTGTAIKYASGAWS
jgi:hypothetical protein